MRAPLGASSVHPVVRVTGNFTSEAPLSVAVQQSLLAAFDQGWADPKKLSQASAKAAILRNQSVENIAHGLGVKTDELHILGEPSLGHFLSIAGLLKPASDFFYSATDKGKIRAIARAHPGISTEMSVDPSGQIIFPQTVADQSVVSVQLANGETGIIQKIDNALLRESFVALDATSSGNRVSLPPRWDTAVFDAQSWGGPSGLGILAISNVSRYTYPLPRIAPISVPGSFSLPLLIAASVAMESFVMEDTAQREFLISQLKNISGLVIVGEGTPSLPHQLSCIVDGVSAEHLVRNLSARGFDIDSGSACSPEDLQPSHVIAAMGLPTNGHLRFTLHQETSKDEIESLVKNLQEVIEELRR